MIAIDKLEYFLKQRRLSIVFSGKICLDLSITREK